jgi:hypothetical protein
MSVIDSNILERDAGGKPLHTFPHPALGPVQLLDDITRHIARSRRIRQPDFGCGLGRLRQPVDRTTPIAGARRRSGLFIGSRFIFKLKKEI